jgi:hypothetical protein
MQSAQTATVVARVATVFFFMARSPLDALKAICRSQCWRADLTNLTVIAALSFEIAKAKFH